MFTYSEGPIIVGPSCCMLSLTNGNIPCHFLSNFLATFIFYVNVPRRVRGKANAISEIRHATWA